MIVAAAAIECEGHPCEAGGFDAVDHGFGEPFFGDAAAFAIETRVAVEAGGD